MKLPGGPLIENIVGSFLVLKLETKWRLFECFEVKQETYGGPQVQHTNIFQNTQIYFKTHKYISKCTNIFQNTQIYFKTHKYN